MSPSAPRNTVTITCTINRNPVSVDVAPMTRLLDLLRENLSMTGTKEGCGEGECGSCSVRINGQLVNSCLVPAIQLDGAEIQTVEGLADAATLHPLQQAFLDCGGAQCGICTPGMLMAATDLLARIPQPSLDQVREGLAGNLCRCTGFVRIFDSMLKAALDTAQMTTPPLAKDEAANAR